MGLSASQFRYLSLTARKSDLEYQAQIINNARLDLASASSAAAKAYSEGMNNQCIRISYNSTGTDGKTAQVWKELTYENVTEQGYQIIGANGTSVIPSPYTEYPEGTIITSMEYAQFTTAEQAKCTKNADGTYTVNSFIRKDAKANFNGMDIQSFLVSGQGQIVTQSFFDYLCEHGYGTGTYYNEDEKGQRTETTYAQLLDAWQSNSSTKNLATIVDWRSDTTSKFKQTNYTEDDAQVTADYEAKTAEIQQQDKTLECQLKQIETEHKAIETEMEAVQKVIQKNVENSYKTFGNA